jgi:hypothetical protein
VGATFFLRGENAIVIGVEQAKYGFTGLAPAAVFEDLNVSSPRRSLADMLRNLDWTVVGIIVPDEAADESDEGAAG